jgi:hypothetical protein
MGQELLTTFCGELYATTLKSGETNRNFLIDINNKKFLIAQNMEGFRK